MKYRVCFAPSVFLGVLLLLVAPALATETITFDAGLEGMVQTSGTVTWDAGSQSVKIQRPSGYGNNSSEFQIQSNASFRSEFEAAVANGGTLSFDATILASDYDPGDAPNWFEILLDPNTQIDGFGADVFINPGFNFATLQADGSQTANISVDMSAFGTGYDNIVASSYANVHFGSNNDGANLAGDAIIYVDNLSITAVVPEPTSMGLCIVAGLMAMFVRRRR